MEKREFFKIEGNTINRIRKHCPKCGPGVFIAEHKDRMSCGKCGYTEFKSGVSKEIKPAKDEQPKSENVKKEAVIEEKIETSSEKIQEKFTEENKE
jgi:ubiquitin-small subunit ribosomal protein S27Ae